MFIYKDGSVQSVEIILFLLLIDFFPFCFYYRATLLLVPLLGLQYILTPFRPGEGHPYEAAYESTSIIFSLSVFCNNL